MEADAEFDTDSLEWGFNMLPQGHNISIPYMKIHIIVSNADMEELCYINVTPKISNTAMICSLSFKYSAV